MTSDADGILLLRQAIARCDEVIERLQRRRTLAPEGSVEFEEIADNIDFFAKLKNQFAAQEAELLRRLDTQPPSSPAH